MKRKLFVMGFLAAVMAAPAAQAFDIMGAMMNAIGLEDENFRSCGYEPCHWLVSMDRGAGQAIREGVNAKQAVGVEQYLSFSR